MEAFVCDGDFELVDQFVLRLRQGVQIKIGGQIKAGFGAANGGSRCDYQQGS